MRRMCTPRGCRCQFGPRSRGTVPRGHCGEPLKPPDRPAGHTKAGQGGFTMELPSDPRTRRDESARARGENNSQPVDRWIYGF